MLNEAIWILEDGVSSVEEIDKGMICMVRAGHSGRKTGQGFYGYDNEWKR